MCRTACAIIALEFFTINKKLLMLSVLAPEIFTEVKKKLPPVELNMDQVSNSQPIKLTWHVPVGELNMDQVSNSQPIKLTWHVPVGDL